MTIHLFFSNLIEKLAEKLDEALNHEKPSFQDVFHAPMLIVPNTNLKKWIQLYLAQRNGIIFNIDFQYLESGLWHLLELLDQNQRQQDLLNLNLRQLLILHVLKNRNHLNEITQYINASDIQPNSFDTKRLWQLSEKLAFLFQEYEFHRYEMISGWLKDKIPTDTMESCQKQVYLETRKLSDQYVNSDNRQLASLMELSEEIFSRPIVRHSNKAEENNDVHFFGFSNISPFHLDLIKKLEGYFNIFIYAINPCREFWEDISTPWENKRTRQHSFQNPAMTENESFHDPGFPQAIHLLLSLWGKPGRENIRTLCQLVDYDFNTCYVLKNKHHSVLEKIQNQVLTFQENKEFKAECVQDTSLQIAACPSRFREVETVYNSILYNLAQDSSLRLTDIAIQLPDISVYKPCIDAVFDRYPKVITYNLADAHAHVESQYGKAIMGLLELADGRFSRQKVIKLMLNPCLMDKWSLTHEDIQVFAKWCQALNIFHTYDQDSKIKKGYHPSDMYTWKQGLTRLKLSRIFSEPWESYEEENLPPDLFHRHFQEKIPFSDIYTDNTELLEKFSTIIETLYYVSRELSRDPFPGQIWKQKFTSACDCLFVIPSEMYAEKTVQKELYSAIDELCILDRITKTKEEKALTIDLAMFKEFILSRLSSIRGGYGDYLTSGVTISALLPMRPIPFRIVYVLGMEEGAFPGKAETSSLDLRLKKTQAGDISIPERNCYLFLELLLSVKEKLYITYVSKNLQKDQTLEPSSVVNQLRRYVESEILGENQSFKITEIPLKGSSEKYMAKNAVSEYSDILVNQSTADRIIYYREKGFWPKVLENISRKENDIISEFTPDFSLVSTNAHEKDILDEKITTRQLSRFLKDPVKQSIQKHLLLYDHEETVEDIIIFEDEPFYSEFPVNFTLIIEPLRMWIDFMIANRKTGFQKKLSKEIFQKTYDWYRIQNQTPESIYGILDMETLSCRLDQWVDTLTPCLTDMLHEKNNLYHALYAGETTDTPLIPFISFLQMNTLKLESLHTQISTFDAFNAPIHRLVEIHGRLPWLWKDQTGTWQSLILTGSGKKPTTKPDRFIIEPVLTYFMIRCLEKNQEPFGELPLVFHVAYENEIKSWNCYVTRDEAIDYIQGLVGQYLNPCLRRWLPFDKVIDAAGKLEEICPLQDEAYFREKFETKLAEALAENNDPFIHLSGPEIDRYCLQAACERFGIFFKYLSIISS